MKTLTFLLIALLTGSGFAFASVPRQMTADMYLESYAAAMRRQAMMTTADIRAGEYRTSTEIYDQHHNRRQLGDFLEDAVRVTTLTPVQKKTPRTFSGAAFENYGGLLAWLRPETA